MLKAGPCLQHAEMAPAVAEDNGALHVAQSPHTGTDGAKKERLTPRRGELSGKGGSQPLFRGGQSRGSSGERDQLGSCTDGGSPQKRNQWAAWDNSPYAVTPETP